MHKHLASNTLNSWKIFVKSTPYIITPAHNVIYKKNNKIIKSDFIKNINYDWTFHKDYLKDFSPEFDLAWIKNNNIPVSECLTQNINDNNLSEVNFYFLQPRHFNGNMTNNFVMGAMSGIIYQSPGSSLYEGINIGFRGMSGAICIDSNYPTKYVGMFVRLAKNLGSDLNASTLDINETKEAKRGLIMPNKRIEDLICSNSGINVNSIVDN
jgi:hypothetical protein